MKKFIKLTSIILILVMVLAGCGGGDQSENPVNGQEERSENGGSEQGGEGESSGEKVIRMSVSGTPKVDPATGIDGGSSIAMVNVYDSLVLPQTDGSIAPSIAESWEISDDNLTYIFKLKEGVKFHDGTDLTASDVVFSLERFLTIGEGNSYIFKDISEVNEIDEYTVEITLSKPFGPFLITLPQFYIVSEDAVMNNMQDGPYGDYGDYGREYLLTNDAGSGPYTVTEVKQQDYVEAVKFDDYWGGWDNADAPVKIKLIDNTEASTVRTLMGNKELEIADEWQSTENINAMMKLEGVSLNVFLNGATQNFMYNNKKAPTDDVNFRRALNHLFDYDTISNNILVDSPQSIGPVAASVPGANTDLEQFTFDLEKAAEYLAQSKYKDSLDDYPIEMTIISDVADHEKIALAFQAAAQQVGLTVNIAKAPWLSVQEQVAQVETTPNMICISVPPTYFEAGAALTSRYHSNSTGTWEQAEWLLNDEIDGLIEDALETVDKEERFQKYNEIQEKLFELSPTAWLVDNVQRHVYQSSYIEWPVAELVNQGEMISLPAGYPFDFKTFKVMEH